MEVGIVLRDHGGWSLSSLELLDHLLEVGTIPEADEVALPTSTYAGHPARSKPGRGFARAGRTSPVAGRRPDCQIEDNSRGSGERISSVAGAEPVRRQS
jgi:hypothetical protein